MFRMTDHRIRKQITDKQTNAGEMTENKSGKELRISKKSKQTQNVCPEMAANK